MAERFKALVSKTSGVLVALVGSNPTPSAISLSITALSGNSEFLESPALANQSPFPEKANCIEKYLPSKRGICSKLR